MSTDATERPPVGVTRTSEDLESELPALKEALARLEAREKTAAGFTAHYDNEGNFVRRTTRDEELADYLAGSFGFPKKASFNFLACVDELEKLGAISAEEARRAMRDYESLERNKPTPADALRYGAIGAVAGPTISGISDVIKGSKPFAPVAGQSGWKGVARNIAGTAVAGALGSGAVPIIRHHFDRRAKMKTLQQFMDEHEAQQEARAQGMAPKIAAPLLAATGKTPGRVLENAQRVGTALHNAPPGKGLGALKPKAPTIGIPGLPKPPPVPGGWGKPMMPAASESVSKALTLGKPKT